MKGRFATLPNVLTVTLRSINENEIKNYAYSEFIDYESYVLIQNLTRTHFRIYHIICENLCFICQKA